MKDDRRGAMASAYSSDEHSQLDEKISKNKANLKKHAGGSQHKYYMDEARHLQQEKRRLGA